MEVSSWVFGIMAGTALLAAFGSASPGDLYDVDPVKLAEIWEREHVTPREPNGLRHAELQEYLQRFAREFPAIARLEKIGSSTEGREITLLSLGSGAAKIMLWSQMHGDEPTATSSLLDLAYFMARHRDERWVGEILQKYTLLCIPMLNPDGAERRQRRNAQGIDINRDARHLQTPEGRLLKTVRDQHQPFLGFNLHNQNSLTTVGDTGNVATIALLAVASDSPGMSPASRQAPAVRDTQPLAKQVTAVIYEALSPFVYGHISRYDEGYNPRAFGDNLTLWGTPIVLIESGGNPAGQAPDFGVKLNFVALLSALNSLAGGKIDNANPAVFDALKMNSDTPIYDLLLRNAWICTGSGIPLFRGDIAVRRDVRGGSGGEAIVADLGDLGVFTAHETIDAEGSLVTPGLIAWDPEQSVFGEIPRDSSYLEKGILTLLETAAWDRIAGQQPRKEWRTASRLINWSFLVAGASGQGNADGLRLAEWLLAGGKGWVRGSGVQGFSSPELDKIPGWLDLETFTEEAARQYQVPGSLEGDPSTVLRRWTSEAAKRFRIPRRGTIAVGNAADLVIWKIPPGGAPVELRECSPSRAIINGRIVEIGAAGSIAAGRFLGR